MSAPLSDRIKDVLVDNPSLEVNLSAASGMKKLPHSVAANFIHYSMQDELLAHFHYSSTAGHPGRAKTLELLARHYYWPAMKFQVHRYVDSCEVCQRSKGHEKDNALKPLPVPAGPWEDISYDFIVKLPKSKRVMTESSSAEDVAHMFLKHVWRLHGSSRHTVSDSGPAFNTKSLRALYKALQIDPRFSTAYHPQTDEQTEIKNKWIETCPCTFVNHEQTDWVDWLPLAEFAHNNAKKEATGKFPFEIIHGRSPIVSPSLEPTGNPVADDGAQEIYEAIQDVMAALQWSQERYKQADRGKPPSEFAVGDKVWLLSLHITSQRPDKLLDHKRYGPYIVAERISSHAYRLELPDTRKIHDVFLVSLLSPVVKDTDFNRTSAPPPPIVTKDGEAQFEVDKFLHCKINDGKWHYRVRWKGYGPLDDMDFLANFPNAPAPGDPVPVSQNALSLPSYALPLLLLPTNLIVVVVYSAHAAMCLLLEKNYIISVDLHFCTIPHALINSLNKKQHLQGYVMSARTPNHCKRVAKDTYDYHSFGFMYCVNANSAPGTATLRGETCYCWLHFIASKPTAFASVMEWHSDGIAYLHTPSPVQATTKASSEGSSGKEDHQEMSREDWDTMLGALRKCPNCSAFVAIEGGQCHEPAPVM
ncbi:Retrotransposable element Tf2 protein [Ceratobasidium sp. AG-Ba]|nr:Retrotransposable element Tf2 protein [Ceratobasidium sp. AG-Ba]